METNVLGGKAGATRRVALTFLRANPASIIVGADLSVRPEPFLIFLVWAYTQVPPYKNQAILGPGSRGQRPRLPWPIKLKLKGLGDGVWGRGQGSMTPAPFPTTCSYFPSDFVGVSFSWVP